MMLTNFPTKELPIIPKLFPKYKKKVVNVRSSASVTLHSLNWDSGTRNEYFLVDLTTNSVRPVGNNMSAPWDNKDEGSKFQLQPNEAVVQLGTFCGKPSKMTVVFHPDYQFN